MALILSFVVIVCGCLYATAVRKRIGHSTTTKERLSWTLPALVLIIVAPCLISVEEAAIVQGLQAWGIGWVGGGKLVSIALKTSPIDVNGSAPQFLLQLALPILPVDRVKDPDAPAQNMASIFTKLLISVSFVLFIFVPLTRDLATQSWKPHPVVEAAIVCGVLWSFLETLFHSLNLLAAAFGVPTQPCMRNPLFSSSLRDFWARRWNLPTSESLRITCYDPLVAFLAPPTPAPNGAATSDPAHPTAASSAAPSPSARTITHRSTAHKVATGSHTATGASVAPAGGRPRRTPRQQWAAFAGLSLAFFLSGAVHHWLLGLFTKMDLLSDYRFGTLFWIQPPIMSAQEAWLRSQWWRGIKGRAPTAAWAAQWATTLVLFIVPCWFLMRDPFLDNDGGREFVLYAMRDLGAICTAVLPAEICTAGARLEPLLDAAFRR